eukprot:TRINITY_DN2663_c0_g1_i3.p1 TRINITY_DN2663_c0_g1~~TRINITY_DN2663_c0_g1_i3.p1  ORF type:complete len:4154 (-),score=649.07 TRINITY_DN2663_c0_g1_i3:236-12697(-)
MDLDAEAEPERSTKPDASNKRVALTAEQKEKMHEWHKIAETNLKIHQYAERRYERLFFWASVLPTLVISALSSVLSLMSDLVPQFQYWGIILALLNTLNSIIIGVSAFWKWQAKMEKGRFASQEYDNLKQRLNIWRTKIEYGEMRFMNVLHEVEQTLNDIMKTCGPPDQKLVEQINEEMEMHAFNTAKRLERKRQKEQVSIWWRVLCCCCWRDLHKHRKWPFNSSVKESKVAPTSEDEYSQIGIKCIEDQLKDLDQRHSMSDIRNLLALFWTMFEKAAIKADMQRCERLLKVVPWSSWQSGLASQAPSNNSAEQDMDDLLKAQANGRTPLHLAAKYQFSELGLYLFKNFPDLTSIHCLMQDTDGQIPYLLLEELAISDDEQELKQFKDKLFFETFLRYCIVKANNCTNLAGVADEQKMAKVKCTLQKRITDLADSARKTKKTSRKEKDSYNGGQFRAYMLRDVTCEVSKHSLLHVLAYYGEMDFVGYIIGDCEEVGAGPEDPDNISAVKLLCMASKDTIDELRYALGCAIHEGHVRMFKYLMENAVLRLLRIYDNHNENEPDLDMPIDHPSSRSIIPIPMDHPDQKKQLHRAKLHTMLQTSLKALIKNPHISYMSQGQAIGVKHSVPRIQEDVAQMDLHAQPTNSLVAAEGGAALAHSSDIGACCFKVQNPGPKTELAQWSAFTVASGQERAKMKRSATKHGTPKDQPDGKSDTFSLLQIACGYFRSLYLDEKIVQLLIQGNIAYPGKAPETGESEVLESQSGAQSGAHSGAHKPPLSQLLSDQTNLTARKLFYTMVRTALESNYKDPIEELLSHCVREFNYLVRDSFSDDDDATLEGSEPVVKAPDDSNPEVWVKWMNERMKDLKTKEGPVQDSCVNEARRQQLPRLSSKEPSTTGDQKSGLRKFLKYVPKNRASGETLLHVAARAAIRRKEPIYVKLVAYMRILVDYPSLSHYCRDDDDDGTPLRYALKIGQRSSDPEAGSSYTDDMLGQGAPEQKALIYLLMFDDFVFHASRRRKKSQQSGAVLRDIKDKVQTFFDSPELAYDLIECTLTKSHFIRSPETRKIECKTVLHIIGEMALVEDFHFIFQTMPLRGRHISPMFNQPDSEGLTLLHYVSQELALTSADDAEGTIAPSEVMQRRWSIKSSAGSDCDDASTEGHFLSHISRDHYKSLWQEVLKFCRQDKGSNYVQGRTMQDLLDLLALDEKEAKLLADFMPVDQLRLKQDLNLDAVTKDVGVDGRDVAKLFREELFSQSELDALIRRFGSFRRKGKDFLYPGWCQLDREQSKLTMLCGSGIASTRRCVTEAVINDNGETSTEHDSLTTEIDLKFMRQVGGLAYDLMIQTTPDSADIKSCCIPVKIESSADKASWMPCPLKKAEENKHGDTCDALGISAACHMKDSNTSDDMTAAESRLQKVFFQKRVKARYFRIMLVRDTEQMANRKTLNVAECKYLKLATSMILEYEYDVGGEALKPVTQLPRQMLAAWSVPGGGRFSLLYWASKLEHRSCRRLVTNGSEYDSYGPKGEEREPLDLVGPDSELYSDLFVPHFHYVCKKDKERISSKTNLNLFVDSSVLQEFTENQLTLVSHVVDVVNANKPPEHFWPSSAIRQVTHEFELFLQEFAGFTEHQVKQMRQVFVDRSKPENSEHTEEARKQQNRYNKLPKDSLELSKNSWGEMFQLFCEGEVFHKLSENSALRMTPIGKMELVNSLESSQERSGEDILTLSNLSKIVAKIEDICLPVRPLLAQLQKQTCDLGLNSVSFSDVKAFLQRVQVSADTYYSSEQFMKSWKNTLDEKMHGLFSSMTSKQKQQVLEEKCNYNDDNRTVFHYASMYGLQKTLVAVLEESKKCNDHAHMLDKENRAFMTMVCKELYTLFDKRHREIDTMKKEMCDRLQDKLRERHKERLRNLKAEELFEYGQESLHAAAVAGNKALVEHIIDTTGLHHAALKRYIKAADETGVDTAMHIACKEAETEIVKYLASKLEPEAKELLCQKDKSGNSCFHLAAKALTKRDQAVDLLYYLLGKFTSEDQSVLGDMNKEEEPVSVLDIIAAAVPATPSEDEGYKTFMARMGSRAAALCAKQEHTSTSSDSNVGVAALFTACMAGNSSFVTSFLGQCAVKPWTKWTVGGETSRTNIKVAAQSGLGHILASCRSHGAELLGTLLSKNSTEVSLLANQLNIRGNSPLHVAAEHKNPVFMEVLVQHMKGTDVSTFKDWLNKPNEDGFSALAICCEKECVECAEQLFCDALNQHDGCLQKLTAENIRNKFDILQQDLHKLLFEDKDDKPDKFLRLVQTLREQKNKATVMSDSEKLLVNKQGPSKALFHSGTHDRRGKFGGLTKLDTYQCPPLHFAVWHMRKNWILLLLDSEANPMDLDTAGRNALHIAILRSASVQRDDPKEWSSRSQDLDIGDRVMAWEGDQIGMCSAEICRHHHDLPSSDQPDGLVVVDWDDGFRSFRRQKRREVIRVKDYFEHVIKVIELLLEKISRSSKRGKHSTLTNCLVKKGDKTPLLIDDFLTVAGEERYWNEHLQKDFLRQSILPHLQSEISDLKSKEHSLLTQNVSRQGSLLATVLWCLEGGKGCRDEKRLIEFAIELIQSSGESDNWLKDIKLALAADQPEIPEATRKHLLEVYLRRLRADNTSFKAFEVVEGTGKNLIELAFEHCRTDQIEELFKLYANSPSSPFSTLSAELSESTRLEIQSGSERVRFVRQTKQEGHIEALLAQFSSKLEKVDRLWVDRSTGVIFMKLEKSGIQSVETPQHTRARLLTKLMDLSMQSGCWASFGSHPPHFKGGSLLEIALKRGDGDLIFILAETLNFFEGLPQAALATLDVFHEPSSMNLAARQRDALETNGIKLTTSAQNVQWCGQDSCKLKKRLHGSVLMPSHAMGWVQYSLCGRCPSRRKSYFELRLIRIGAGLKVGFGSTTADSPAEVAIDEQCLLYSSLPIIGEQSKALMVQEPVMLQAVDKEKSAQESDELKITSSLSGRTLSLTAELIETRELEPEQKKENNIVDGSNETSLEVDFRWTYKSDVAFPEASDIPQPATAKSIARGCLIYKAKCQKCNKMLKEMEDCDCPKWNDEGIGLSSKSSEGFHCHRNIEGQGVVRCRQQHPLYPIPSVEWYCSSCCTRGSNMFGCELCGDYHCEQCYNKALETCSGQAFCMSCDRFRRNRAVGGCGVVLKADAPISNDREVSVLWASSQSLKPDTVKLTLCEDDSEFAFSKQFDCLCLEDKNEDEFFALFWDMYEHKSFFQGTHVFDLPRNPNGFPFEVKLLLANNKCLISFGHGAGKGSASMADLEVTHVQSFVLKPFPSILDGQRAQLDLFKPFDREAASNEVQAQSKSHRSAVELTGYINYFRAAYLRCPKHDLLLYPRDSLMNAKKDSAGACKRCKKEKSLCQQFYVCPLWRDGCPQMCTSCGADELQKLQKGREGGGGGIHDSFESSCTLYIEGARRTASYVQLTGSQSAKVLHISTSPSPSDSMARADGRYEEFTDVGKFPAFFKTDPNYFCILYWKDGCWRLGLTETSTDSTSEFTACTGAKALVEEYIASKTPLERVTILQCESLEKCPTVAFKDFRDIRMELFQKSSKVYQIKFEDVPATGALHFGLPGRFHPSCLRHGQHIEFPTCRYHAGSPLLGKMVEKDCSGKCSFCFLLLSAHKIFYQCSMCGDDQTRMCYGCFQKQSQGHKSALLAGLPVTVQGRPGTVTAWDVSSRQWRVEMETGSSPELCRFEDIDDHGSLFIQEALREVEPAITYGAPQVALAPYAIPQAAPVTYAAPQAQPMAFAPAQILPPMYTTAPPAFYAAPATMTMAPQMPMELVAAPTMPFATQQAQPMAFAPAQILPPMYTTAPPVSVDKEEEVERQVQCIERHMWCTDRKWLRGDTLCFAVDLESEAPSIRIAVNGVWSQAVRLEGLNPEQDLQPFMAGADFEHSFGFNEAECLYGPPLDNKPCYFTIESSGKSLCSGPGQAQSVFLGSPGKSWWIIKGAGDWYHIQLASERRCLAVAPDRTSVHLEDMRADIMRQRWQIHRSDHGNWCTVSSLADIVRANLLLTASAGVCLESSSSEGSQPVNSNQRWYLDNFEEWHSIGNGGTSLKLWAGNVHPSSTVLNGSEQAWAGTKNEYGDQLEKLDTVQKDKAPNQEVHAAQQQESAEATILE